MMNHDPDWLSALLCALHDPDPRSAIRDLFDRIAARTDDLHRSENGRRFLSLMAAVEQHYRRRAWSPLTAAAFRTVVKRCRSSPRRQVRPIVERSSPWQAEYQQLAEEITQTIHRGQVFELMVSCDERAVTRFPLAPAPFEHSIADVGPGYWELRTDTGWRLWARQLKDTDLILSALRPRRALRLAAQSQSTTPKPTKWALLKSTSLLVSVFPGVESGSIRIQRPAVAPREPT